MEYKRLARSHVLSSDLALRCCARSCCPHAFADAVKACYPLQTKGTLSHGKN